MADGVIQVPPDSTGAKLDTEELTVGANTVHRERIQVAGDSDTDIAQVTADNGLEVDVTRSALPTGAATSAAQTTAQTTLEAIETAVELLDNTVSGTELQVDVVASLPAGSNNIGDVDLASSIPAGTNNIGDVDVLTLPGVAGTAAHDAAASGNPVLTGAQMETMADTAPGTRSSTDGDATKLATTDGALFVIPTGPQRWSYHSNGSTALTDAEVHAAPGAGLSLYVTDITVSSGAATAMNVFFEEGSTTVLGPWYLEAVAGRGVTIQFQTPKKVTANTALTVTTSASIAHSVDVQGFTAPG